MSEEARDILIEDYRAPSRKTPRFGGSGICTPPTPEDEIIITEVAGDGQRQCGEEVDGGDVAQRLGEALNAFGGPEMMDLVTAAPRPGKRRRVGSEDDVDEKENTNGCNRSRSGSSSGGSTPSEGSPRRFWEVSIPAGSMFDETDMILGLLD